MAIQRSAPTRSGNGNLTPCEMVQHRDRLETPQGALYVVFGSDDDNRNAQLAELVREPFTAGLAHVARHDRRWPVARKGLRDIHDHSTGAADQMVRKADHGPCGKST